MKSSLITKETIDRLEKITGNKIAGSILHDIVESHNYNEFGFGMLEPKTFGEKYGFSLEFLQAQNKQPYEKRIYATSPGNKHISNLENAMFTLTCYPVKSVYAIAEKTHRRLVTLCQNTRAIKNFSVHEIDGEFSYAFQLEKDFLLELLNSMSESDKNSEQEHTYNI